MSFNTKQSLESFNTTICNKEHFKLSQRNLIMIYIFLYDFVKNNDLTGFNNYLNKTNYLNKIIFLKYLSFFKSLNELKKRTLHELTCKINKLPIEIARRTEELNDLVNSETYESDPKKMKESQELEEIIEELEDELEDDTYKKKIKKNKKTKQLIETRNVFIQDEFILNATNILTDDPENFDTEDIETLFNEDIINYIYNNVIKNINNPDSFTDNFNEYMTLFHLNPIKTKSSDKARFYIGVHGTLLIVVPNNTYLTIASPVNTTINRWGERGEPIKYLNSMDYTFKQCLLAYGDGLTNDIADTCFDLLGERKKEYNLDIRQTTPAYCVPEPSNYFSNLTDFNKNSKMRIKHYSVDSYNFMIFNNDYTIPDTLLNNLSLKIPELKNTQYNNAENIINLNFLLFTNNINFTIFNRLNIEEIDEDPDYYAEHDENQCGRDGNSENTLGLYPDIGLYYRYYLEESKINIQSDLHDYYFPLDIIPLEKKLFSGDFALDRDIYALNDINIHLKYKDVDRSFVLLKGDSFLCNPYIIEYFIKTFNSKITIRPGPILGNQDDDIFKENSRNHTTRERGSTITCLSKGLSCYKVAISVLTNYEILQFCKDANINTCDLYDTSCQTYLYIDDNGKFKDDYTHPVEQTRTLKRQNTVDDANILKTYDNLSDILFDNLTETSINFKVIGNQMEKSISRSIENTNKRKRKEETQKRKRRGGTQKRKRGRTRNHLNRKIIFSIKQKIHANKDKIYTNKINYK